MQPGTFNNPGTENDPVSPDPVATPTQSFDISPSPLTTDPLAASVSPEPATAPEPMVAPGSPFQPVTSPFQSQPQTEAPTFAPEAPTPSVVTDVPESNVSDLTLYLVVLFSGLSTIASASYLAWTILNHFLSKPDGFSFFDFSTFNIYVLLYLVLFGTVNILASLRLEKRVKEQGAVSSSLSTVGAIWRALLVVWGVSAVVGILYAPLSASIVDGEGGVGSSIAIDVLSALIAIALIVGFFWRDTLLHKVRSALIPTATVAAIVGLIAGVGAFTTLNPKKAETPSPMYDYSSSFDDYETDEAMIDESSEEYNFSETE